MASDPGPPSIREPLPEPPANRDRYRAVGMAIGVAAMLTLLLIPPPAGLPLAAWRVLAVGALMIIWWVTEAIPVGITGLIPLVAFPLLGLGSIETAAAPYADGIIFLFLGGLILGLAVEKWGLHRRLAGRVLRLAGHKPANLVLAFMVATAAVGLLGISNTANAAMMLPIALAIATAVVHEPGQMFGATHAQRNFVRALLLGVAYAASVAGMGTLIGTPPNLLLAGFMERSHGYQIGFLQWMSVGVPLVIMLLLAIWLLLTRVFFPCSRDPLDGLSSTMAAFDVAQPISAPELRVGAVFVLAAAAWLARPLLASLVPGINNASIAVSVILILFVVPSGRGGALMDWQTASRLPWNMLLLFGGGLSLGAAVAESGTPQWVEGQFASLMGEPRLATIASMIVATVLLSELASNTATAAAILPVAGSVAGGLGLAPLEIALPVALAASCGFMLPIATPPNALVYGTGYLRMGEMIRAGAAVDLVAALLVLVVSQTLGALVFG